MMVPSKIAAVSYLNTVPFIYGIEHAGILQADLLLSPPSGCATAYREGRADLALLPVAALGSLPDAEIVTSFCIGAQASVRTVVVVSDSPIDKVTDIYLDSHSLTSVMLTKLLSAEWWKIKPEFHTLDDYTLPGKAQKTDAFLLIGDKVFAHEGKFKYSRDLADEWRAFTGLPFVFAVWVARKGTSTDLLCQLEDSLNLGVERIYEAIIEYGHSEKEYAYEYLTRNIDFLFDNQKRKALELFWQKGRKFAPHVNPG